MKLRSLFAVSVLMISGVFCVPKIGHSQDKGELLPDIDPQDIEIRGQFKARFPGLSRQPILGFDPNLQVYQIDPNRRPFMESGDDVVARLPVSELSRPAPPEFTGLGYAANANFFARFGVGSYTSPEANVWAAYPINKKSYVGGDLDLSSSDGHLDGRPSSFRFLTAHGEYGTKINKQMELNLHSGVQNDFNYTANFDNGTPQNPQIARITYQGYNLGAELNRLQNGIAGWKLQGNVRSFNTTVENDPLGGSIDELVYNGSFVNRWALGHPNETFSLNIGGRGGNYDPAEQGSQTWGTVQGGVAYERLFNYQTHVRAEADVFYTSDVNEQKVYPGGLLQVDHWLGNRLKIIGKVEAKPHLNSVEQLHEQNRFLGYNNQLLHTYSVDVTGQASLKYYRGSKLHFGVTYTNAQNYAFFTPNTIGGSSTVISPEPLPMLDVYTINYQDATNFKLFAGITHQLLPERFWISAEAYVQNPELDGGTKIPFEQSWGAKASISFRPVDLLTIKGWTNYVPKRNTNITNDEEIDGFFLVGSQLDLNVTDNFGAYLKLVNMLGQDYQVWKGYRERPFQVYGGLTLKF